MKTLLFVGAVVLAAGEVLAQSAPQNPLVDSRGFLQNALAADKLRPERLLTEEEFHRAMEEPGVVILDARSAAKFKLRHLRGAVNLSLPDFTAEELARIVPSKATKVLIYCNNNFAGSEEAFPAKIAVASLNLSTFATLYSYGYRNVYELGPLIDVASSSLPFGGTEVRR